MSLAPIVVFVYKRLQHTKKMFESLENNHLSAESDLFIFSDGYKNDDDKQEVLEVRRYVNSICSSSKFKNVHIKESRINNGLANSVISGVNEIINNYGKVIVIEDDLEISGDFLLFMNGALDYFQGNEKIWSISGYTPKLKSLDNYHKDVYLGYRGFCWGWGTWKDRWVKVDWEVRDYHNFLFNWKKQKLFCRGGNDLPSMLRAQMKGKIDSWYIRWTYQQSKENMLTVYPKISRVSNMGLDGSGSHCRSEDMLKFDAVISTEDTKNEFDDIQLVTEIVNDFAAVYKLTLPIRIRDKYREIMRKL